MKKILALALLLAACLSVFTACGDLIDTISTVENDENIISDAEKDAVDTPTTKDEMQSTSTEEDESSYDITYANAKAYTDSIGTIWVQSIIEITNTGTKPLYLNSGAYDLEDENGALIASKTMVSVYPSVISAGERAYYYDETTMDKLDSEKKLTIVPRPDVKDAKVENIRLKVTDFELSEGQYKGLKMLGRVENITDKEESMIYVVAILYDENSNPIGQIFTILTDALAPNNKIGFEGSSFALPNNISIEDVASYEVYAYPLQYQF